MERLLRLMATVAIVSSALPVLRVRVVLAKTTLVEAWRWGVFALSLWAGTWLVTELVPIAREGLADQLWFASAVTMVAPFIAVLGARRPGSRVWSWFIVLPMTIVLFLPAVTAWNRDLQPTPLRLEVAMLVGYGLVLLMGAGNFLGTRFAVSAFLAALACLSVLWPMSSLASWCSWDSRTTHAAATIGLSVAIWAGYRQAIRTRRARPNSLESVWIDFRDFFGVVWGRRVLDRVNDAAKQEHWPVRLHLDGFASIDSANQETLSPEQSGRIEQVVRWLLRRFVDPEWIEERMGKAP
jgi:hypothetical protein